MATPDGANGTSTNGTSRTAKLLHGSRAGNPDGRMPLLDHIRELRNRLIVALVAALVGSIIGWFTFHPVWAFIQHPYCRLHLYSQLPGQPAQTCTLYVTGIFDSLFLHLKIAIITGLLLSSPVWMYQLWAFLAPGLYARERRYAYFFAGSALPLFAVGGAIAYFAMTKGLHFLLLLVPHNVQIILTINNYLGYALAMLVIFGIAFELPLLFVLLNLIGVLTHQRFRKWRRMIIFLIFAFAAVFTPSPDPISMLLLAVPCVLLVECAEIFAWQHDKRKARRVGAYPGLSDEAIAELAEQDSRSSTEAL